jgi:hypothetical protein
LIVGPLPLGPVEPGGRGPALGGATTTGTVEHGAPDELGHLAQLIGHTLPDPPAIRAVDEDEER